MNAKSDEPNKKMWQVRQVLHEGQTHLDQATPLVIVLLGSLTLGGSRGVARLIDRVSIVLQRLAAPRC